jgi:hypothetical protein
VDADFEGLDKGFDFSVTPSGEDRGLGLGLTVEVDEVCVVAERR